MTASTPSSTPAATCDPTDLCRQVARHNEQVRQALRDRLLALDFHAFEQFIGHLIAVMGYVDVRVTERTSDGGLDIEAYTQTGITKALIISQVKKYTSPVHRRFVDELRGTMLRVGAQQGLLITTATFSEGAKQAAESNHIAPVTLIDGEQLLDLLFVHQVGVSKEALELWTFDTAFFDRLNSEKNGGRI
jgi:restriction system protein